MLDRAKKFYSEHKTEILIGGVAVTVGFVSVTINSIIDGKDAVHVHLKNSDGSAPMPGSIITVCYKNGKEQKFGYNPTV